MKDKTEKGYHKLLVWQKAYGLVIQIYKISTQFPKNEEFGLSSQLRRAAVSVVLNIVEGYRRHTRKDFLHFLNLAASSLTEVEAALELSFGLKYMKKEVYMEIDDLISELAYLLGAFTKSLQK